VFGKRRSLLQRQRLLACGKSSSVDGPPLDGTNSCVDGGGRQRRPGSPPRALASPSLAQLHEGAVPALPLMQRKAPPPELPEQAQSPPREPHVNSSPGAGGPQRG